jgi:hypothetical protein
MTERKEGGVLSNGRTLEESLIQERNLIQSLLHGIIALVDIQK